MEEYEILKMIQEDENVIKAEVMPDEMKKEVLRIEMDRLNELVPLINKGIEEAFDEDQQAIIIKESSDNSLNADTNSLTPTLTLVSENGTVIGEEIFDKEEQEELRQRSDVYFISENFVTYTNLSVPGEKQFFVVRSVNREFFTDKKIEDTVSSLVVAIPSTNTDNYLKDSYGYDHTDKIGILIIGFTV